MILFIRTNDWIERIITNIKEIHYNFQTQLVYKTIAIEWEKNWLTLSINEIDEFEVFNNIEDFEKRCSILERL